MADDNPGCMLIIGIIGGIIVIALVIVAAITALALALSVGSLFGSGTALKNYYLAFRSNVCRERV